MPNNTLPIGGVNGRYTATLTNNGGALSGAVLQGYIVQGSARRAAGGVVANCGSGSGILPTGTCTMSFAVGASNTGSGSGTLADGVATFELDLTAGSTTVSRSIGVNLIPGAFSAIGSKTLSLSGAVGGLSVGISNTGSQAVSGLSYQTTVIQGSARRSAGSMPMACGLAGWGNLPGFTNCSMTIYIGVTNTTSGTGTLVAGAATFTVELLQGLTVLSSQSWPLTLVDARFTSVTASPNPVIIGGGAQNGAVTLSNAGPSIAGVAVYGYVRQGPTLRGGQAVSVSCGAGTGVLPTGTCTASVPYKAESYSAGDGMLVPGAATLAVVARASSGVIVDSVNVPITLVAPPTFASVTPAGVAKIGLPGPIVNYTATLSYAGAPIANASVKVRIIQGTANREANSGPVNVNCGAGDGTIPAGSCTFSSIFFATNTGVGVGQFVPGAAQLQIQLSDPLNGVLATQLVPITLVP